MSQRIVKVGLLAAALAVSVAPAWAFTPGQKTTVSAGVTTGGTKTASFTLKIRDVVSPLTTPDRSSIAWSGVNPANTAWKIADQLLLLNATVTDNAGGVQIYTDNTASDASPKFVDPTPTVTNNPDSDPSGLVQDDSDHISSNKLSMAWSIKGAAQTVGTSLLAADPNNGPESGAGNKYQWLFLLDKKTPAIDFDGNGTNDTTAFTNGDPFVTMVNVVGIHGAQGPGDFFAFPDGQNSFVYLQANFSNAAAQTPYGTSKLTVEAFTE